MFSLMLVAALARLAASPLAGEPDSFGVSARAEAEIPAQYLGLYQQAAQRYGLDWAILAGIGKVGCD
jgi:hypothetical protein